MDKENKSLVDNHDGDFILNESGTSINADHDEPNVKKPDEISDKMKTEKEAEKPDERKDG